MSVFVLLRVLRVVFLQAPAVTSMMVCVWKGVVSTRLGVFNQTSPSLPLQIYGVVGLFIGCWTSQQHASVSQGRICSDNFTCCHTEIEVVDQTFYLTQSQYTDTGLTSPSADPITPGAWQGSHWSANFWVTGMTLSRKKSHREWDSNPGSSALEADALPLGQRGGPMVWDLQYRNQSTEQCIQILGPARDRAVYEQ